MVSAASRDEMMLDASRDIPPTTPLHSQRQGRSPQLCVFPLPLPRLCLELRTLFGPRVSQRGERKAGATLEWLALT